MQYLKTRRPHICYVKLIQVSTKKTRIEIHIMPNSRLFVTEKKKWLIKFSHKHVKDVDLKYKDKLVETAKEYILSNIYDL